nr:hypothetical protein [uncultured organism]
MRALGTGETPVCNTPLAVYLKQRQQQRAARPVDEPPSRGCEDGATPLGRSNTMEVAIKHKRHSDEYVILPADHPYVKQFEATVSQVRDQWRVTWRDFGTVAQEHYCSNETEARVVADRLKRHADIIFGCDYLGMTVEEAERFWL